MAKAISAGEVRSREVQRHQRLEGAARGSAAMIRSRWAIASFTVVTGGLGWAFDGPAQVAGGVHGGGQAPPSRAGGCASRPDG